MNAQHHLHIRKRVHQKKEEYPHPIRWKRYLDYLTIFVGVVAPLMTFAQVWKIWSEQSASSSSWLTWGMYFIASVVWTIYGIAHKERTVMVSQALYTIGTGLVLIGIALF